MSEDFRRELFLNIPLQYLTYEICYNFVALFRISLKFIEKKFIDGKLCNIALSNNPTDLVFVPQNYRTLELYNDFFNYYKISNIDTDLESMEINMWLIAFEKKLVEISRIPLRAYVTEEIICEGVTSGYLLIKNLNKEKITKKIWLCALNRNRYYLEEIPLNNFAKEDIYDFYLEFAKHESVYEEGDFNLIPHKYRTKEIYEIGADINIYVIKYIPLEYLTYSMCKIAIINNILKIDDIPKNLRDENLWLIFLQSHDYNILEIPEDERTEKIWIYAINNSYNQIEDIPQNERTLSIFEIFFSYYYTYDKKMEEINKYSDEIKSQLYCLMALDGKKIWHLVPDNYKTIDFYKFIINKKPEFINDFPKELLIKKYWENIWLNIMVKLNQIELIPEEYLTLEICIEIVNNVHDKIRYVPEKFKTKELCENLEPVYLEFIPENIRNESLYLGYVGSLKNYKWEIIPDKFKTIQMWTVRIKKNPYDYINVPIIFKNEEMLLNMIGRVEYNFIKEIFKKETHIDDFMIKFYIKLIKHDLNLLQDIPSKFKTEEFYTELILYYQEGYKYVPSNLTSEQFWINILNQKKNIFAFISKNKEIITKNLCVEAIKINVRNLCHVPQNLIKEVLDYFIS